MNVYFVKNLNKILIPIILVFILFSFSKSTKNTNRRFNFKKLEKSLQQQNSYYLDLINGNVLKPLIITKIKKDGFKTYMKSIGKLGGQNKIPRLSNDRKIADVLNKLQLTK